MKTISGNVASSKQISLSKAARVLSNFIGAETGASNDVSAYLSRASASFDELVQFHRELKGSKSDQKQRNHVKEVGDDVVSVKIEESRGDSEVGLKGRREKRKERDNGGEIGDFGEMGSPKKKKKRRRTETDQ